MPVGLYQSPKAREKYTKLFSIARTDTTSNIKAYLPKGAVIINIDFVGSLNSNAGTTAVINIGTTSGATDVIVGYDVKTGATGQRQVAGAASSVFATVLTADTPLWCTYVETGAASSAGGPWLCNLEYMLLGPGESLTD
jgi:hypothetical protein